MKLLNLFPPARSNCTPHAHQTRSEVVRWRSGFARIAASANVPVLPAVVDYAGRRVTFARLIEDVGDAEQTLAAVQQAASLGRGRRSGARAKR